MKVMKKVKGFRFDEKGSALIAAVGILFMMDLFAVAALGISVSQMTLATSERHTNQAFNVAEAGLNKAIWKIGNVVDYAPTETAPDTGVLDNGEYSIYLTSVAGSDTQKRISATGYSPDRTSARAKKRKIEATVETAPLILSFGLFTGGWVDHAGSAEVFFAPLDYRVPGARAADFGSNDEIYYQDDGVTINNPGSSTFDALFGNPPIAMGDIILAGPAARLSVKGTIMHTAAEFMAQENKAHIRNLVFLAEPIQFPTFNFEGSPYEGSYKQMAGLNMKNAGKYGLAVDHNGIFTKAEFAALIAANSNLVLEGVIFVDGEVSIGANRNVTINDGGLVVKNVTTSVVALNVASRGALTVGHSSQASKRLPGVALFSAEGNKARFTDAGTVLVDGILYAESTSDLTKGNLTIRGCFLVKAAVTGASVIAKNGTVILQYDPDVTVVSGITNPGSSYVRRIVTWKEVAP